MPRVLVVDDDPTVLETSRLVLGRAGHEVTLADRGAAALSALRARPFDLVFADYRLPDFSGLDLLRLVRSDTNPVPFVVITGFGSPACMVQALKLGAADFVEKPVDVDQLTDLAARYAASGRGSSPAPTPPNANFLSRRRTRRTDGWVPS